jgi:hypothetical protein
MHQRWDFRDEILFAIGAISARTSPRRVKREAGQTSLRSVRALELE